jgi:high-affinity iron transporter
MSALRTAHEAGWVTIGQQQVFNFSSWMPGKSLQGALITGVFGVPADPRLVEVLGWLLYTVPVLAVFLWPARLARSPRSRQRLLAAAAAALLTVAAVLAIAVPSGGSAPADRPRTVTDRAGHTTTVSLVSKPGGRSLSIAGAGCAELTAGGTESLDGVGVQVWQATVSTQVPPDAGPVSVTLQELMTLTGGRLPVGVAAGRAPGPFRAQWATNTVYTVLAHGDSMVSARAVSNRTAVLDGGGLTAPKTVSVGGLPTDWSTARSEDASTAAQIAASDRDRAERQLWKVWLPLVIAVFAVACALACIASVRGGRTRAEQERKSSHGESHLPGKVPAA